MPNCVFCSCSAVFLEAVGSLRLVRRRHLNRRAKTLRLPVRPSTCEWGHDNTRRSKVEQRETGAGIPEQASDNGPGRPKDVSSVLSEHQSDLRAVKDFLEAGQQRLGPDSDGHRVLIDRTGFRRPLLIPQWACTSLDRTRYSRLSVHD